MSLNVVVSLKRNVGTLLHVLSPCALGVPNTELVVPNCVLLDRLEPPNNELEVWKLVMLPNNEGLPRELWTVDGLV